MSAGQTIPHAVQSAGLADILERVLDKGVVITGDIKIKRSTPRRRKRSASKSGSG